MELYSLSPTMLQTIFNILRSVLHIFHHLTELRNLLTRLLHNHTHTHPYNGLLSGTAWVSRYQKGKTNLDFTEARDIEWQQHQLPYICCIIIESLLLMPAFRSTFRLITAFELNNWSRKIGLHFIVWHF